MARKAEQAAQAARTAPDSLAALAQLIRIGRALERNDHAAYYAQLALDLAPDDTTRLSTAARLHRLAYNAIEDGRSAGAQAYRTRALALYDRLLAIRPDDLDARIDRCLLRVASEQPMVGIQELIQIAKEHPQYYRPHLELGIFSIQTRQLDKARERLEQAQRAKPAAWEPYFYLALLAEDQDQRDQALAYYQKALAAKPEPGIRQLIESKLKDL
jgi:tetratricopeptide (TPR) repeat protein